MKFKHLPTEIIAHKFVEGMQTGFLAEVKDRADPFYYEDVNKLEAHRFRGKLYNVRPAILIGNTPVPVTEEDWIVTEPQVAVLSDEELNANYEPIEEAEDGVENEETETVGRGHQEEDSEESQAREVRQRRTARARANQE